MMASLVTVLSFRCKNLVQFRKTNTYGFSIHPLKNSLSRFDPFFFDTGHIYAVIVVLQSSQYRSELCIDWSVRADLGSTVIELPVPEIFSCIKFEAAAFMN